MLNPDSIRRHYRIESGSSGCGVAEKVRHIGGFIGDETRQAEEITRLDVHTDPSGMVGMVRKYHAVGMTILQFQTVT